MGQNLIMIFRCRQQRKNVPTVPFFFSKKRDKKQRERLSKLCDNSQSHFSEQVTLKSLVHKSVLRSMRRVRARSVETFGRDPRATHCRIECPTVWALVFS